MDNEMTLIDLLMKGDFETTFMLFQEARMLEKAGKYRDALEIYKTVSEKRKLEFGDLHLETIKTNFRMARTLYVLSEYEEALPIFEDICSRMNVVFGPHDGDLLLAKGYLANILRKTRKEAFPIYEEIYNIQSKKWPQKSFTLSTRINIALELCDQGKYNESLNIFDEIYNLQLQMKSEEKNAWSTLQRKSFVLCKQGTFSEALDISKFVYEKEKSALGENHPKTINSLRRIGIILADQSKYDQAESIMKLVISERFKMRNDKLKIFHIKWFLAMILKKHGKFDEAWSLFNELYVMVKEKPREKITLLIAKLLAKIADQQGKYDEALLLYEKVQEMDKPDSPDNVITLKNMKRIIDQQGESNKSGPSPNELYEIESKQFWEICEDCGKSVAEYK